jgi:putative membrane protein
MESIGSILALSVILGSVGGVIAGLFPGIHANTVSQFLTYLGMGALPLAIAITAAAAMNTILSMLPAIFLCVPDQSTVLSVLPGQRLVNEGRGLHAIWICGIAAMLTLVLAFVLLPVSLIAIPAIYDIIKPVVFPILAAICVAFLLQEKNPIKIGCAVFVFILAGILGTLLLDSAILKEPLFAPFIGMFALSNLLLSLNNIRIPYQQRVRRNETVVTMQLLAVIAAGTILGALADLLPAIGSSAQMATFGSMLTVGSPSMFLALTTSVSVSHLVHSFVALHTIDKARIGATAIIRETAGSPDLNTLGIYLAVIAVVMAIGVILLFRLSVPFIQLMRRIDMRIVNALLAVYLIAAVIAIDGFTGLAIAGLATAIGLLPPLLNVRRTHLMGFLLLPALAYLAA